MTLFSMIVAETDAPDTVTAADAHATRVRNHRQHGEALRNELDGIERRRAHVDAELARTTTRLVQLRAGTDEHRATRVAMFDLENALETLTRRIATIQAAISTHDRSKP